MNRKTLSSFSIGLCLCGYGALAAPSDLETADAIENEFLYDPVVEAHEVTTDVDDGAVTLTGSVDTLSEKNKAALLAATVRGVESVDNNLIVEPFVILEPDTLRDNVVEALTLNPATDSWEIEVAEADAVISLRGTVESLAEKEIAGEVAASVAGVSQVENQLELQSDAARSAPEIETEISELLYWDRDIPAESIEVLVDQEGEVDLIGEVPSLPVKYDATAHAWVRGVDSVDASGLIVDADMGVNNAFVASDNAEILSAVESALRADARIDALEIVESIDEGEVTLRGSVGSLSERRTAGQVVRGINGVDSVNNRLRVAESSRSDDEMEAAADARLAIDPITSGYAIDVEVENDVATLEGVVDSYYEKSLADDLVAEISGIRKIKNELAVTYSSEPLVYSPYISNYTPASYAWYSYSPPAPLKTDRQIAEDIRSELFWSPFVDSDQITVTVDDGIAELDGTVDTMEEADAAVENAFEGGAVTVDNELIVASSD